jgi:hypothetical protein
MNQLTIEHDDPAMIERFAKAFNEERTCGEFLPKPEGIGEGWWEFCVKNWGTKWDFGGPEEPQSLLSRNRFQCSFETAWSPPVGLYRELDRLGYRVNATYLEPSTCFCGEFKDGEDHCVEYRSKEMIPRRIWDEYDCRELFEDGTATTE